MKKLLYVFAVVTLMFNFSSCTPNSLVEENTVSQDTLGEDVYEDDEEETD